MAGGRRHLANKTHGINIATKNSVCPMHPWHAIKYCKEFKEFQTKMEADRAAAAAKRSQQVQEPPTPTAVESDAPPTS